MTTHTKTPWYTIDGAEIYPRTGPNAEVAVAHVVGAIGSPSSFISRDEASANASMIVRAVNAHDRLVEALERIVNAHAAMVDDFEEQVVEIAKAALRAAKGEA